MKNWKSLFAGLLLALFVATPAHASLKLFIDDVDRGFIETINVSSTFGTKTLNALEVTFPAMAEGESIVNTTDDLVRIASNDSHIAVEFYSPLTSNGTAELRLTGDAAADATDSFRLKNDAAGNFTIDNDNSVAGTYVNLFNLTSAGVGTIKGTTDGVFEVYAVGTSASDAYIRLIGDAGADASDRWQIMNDSSAGSLIFGNDSTTPGTYVTKATFASTGAISTALGSVKQHATTVVITADTTATLTVPAAVDFIATYTVDTDNEDCTITFSSGGTLGQRCTLLFQTDSGGSADEVMTLHTTLTNTTGTLTLANLTAGRYSIELVSDGTVFNETNRTAALS